MYCPNHINAKRSKLVFIHVKKFKTSLHFHKDCGMFYEGEWDKPSQQPKHDLCDYYGIISRDDLIDPINFIGIINNNKLIGVIGLNGLVNGLDSIIALVGFDINSLNGFGGIIGLVGFGLNGYLAFIVGIVGLIELASLVGLFDFIGLNGHIRCKGFVGRVGLIKLIGFVGLISLIVISLDDLFNCIGLTGHTGCNGFIGCIGLINFTYLFNVLVSLITFSGIIGVSLTSPVGSTGLVCSIKLFKLSKLIVKYPTGLNAGFIGLVGCDGLVGRFF
jgi:hypothetical protein